LRKDPAMPDINVVAAPVATGSAPTDAAAPTEDGTVSVFAAILLQQLADPTSQALLAAKAGLALSAAADAVPAALKTLIPMLLNTSTRPATIGNAGDVGFDGTADDKSDPNDPEPPAIDVLLALPATPQMLAMANTTTTGVTNAPSDLPRATSTEPTLQTLTANSAANPAAPLSAPATVTAAAAQPAVKDSFEALLATTADSRAQASIAPALIAPTHATPATDSSPAPARIESAIGTTAWNTDVGDRMVWMANHGQSRAELVLTPPHLGRIEISLSMSGDQANVVFIAASPAAREALENAMPRLREILADAGVTLAQTQVGADTSGQSANGRENGDNSSQGRAAAAFGGGAAAAALAAGATNPWLRSGRGMVDVFA
jgi:flagellar hook-length control protein FliK